MTETTCISEPVAVPMCNDWYELADTWHFWMRWRYAVVQKYIKPFINPGSKIPEIGCGNRAVMKQFHEELNVAIDGCGLTDSPITPIAISCKPPNRMMTNSNTVKPVGMSPARNFLKIVIMKQTGETAGAIKPGNMVNLIGYLLKLKSPSSARFTSLMTLFWRSRLFPK